MKFMTYLSIAIAVYSIWSKPTRESFIEEMERIEDRDVLSKWVYKLSDFLGVDRGIRLDYNDLIVFSVVRVLQHTSHNPIFNDGNSPTEQIFLGVWGKWIPLSSSEIVGEFKCQSPGCLNGVCAVDHCVCLPSWMGPNCNVPVKRFQSLWSRINPWIPDSRWVIPTSLTTGFQWLNEVAMDIRFHFGLDRLITSFGVMELILLINVVVYLLWKISAVEDEWMETHFTTSFFSTINQRRLHTIITANFSHKSLPHLINNMYGLLIYGPIVYSLIGDTGFWILWGMACVMTSVASLIWKFHFRNPEHRWTRSLGASGCIVALRTAYVLLLYRGDLGSEVIRDNLLSFILIDLLLVVGPSTDFAGHIGGAMAGWLFCFIRKKGILAA